LVAIARAIATRRPLAARELRRHALAILAQPDEAEDFRDAGVHLIERQVVLFVQPIADVLGDRQ
jgi:hypothetical protein